MKIYITTAIILLSALGFSVSAQTLRVAALSRNVPRQEAYLAESVDEQAQFPGGDAAMMRYINSERKYPSEAYNSGVQGRVTCSFIIESDGNIANVNIVKGVDPLLNREAIRVIERMPRWTPARIGHTRVPMYYILTVPFRL